MSRASPLTADGISHSTAPHALDNIFRVTLEKSCSGMKGHGLDITLPKVLGWTKKKYINVVDQTLSFDSQGDSYDVS